MGFIKNGKSVAIEYTITTDKGIVLSLERRHER